MKLRRYLDLESYYSFIKSIATGHPRIARRIVPFEHDRYPVVGLDITDRETDPEDKQHVSHNIYDDPYSSPWTCDGVIDQTEDAPRSPGCQG